MFKNAASAAQEIDFISGRVASLITVASAMAAPAASEGTVQNPSKSTVMDRNPSAAYVETYQSAPIDLGAFEFSREPLLPQLVEKPKHKLAPDEVTLSLRIVHPVIHLDELGIEAPKFLEVVDRIVGGGGASNGGAGDLNVPMPALDLGYYLGDKTVFNLRFACVGTDYVDDAEVFGGLLNVRYRFEGEATSIGVGFQHFVRAIDHDGLNIGVETRADLYYGDLYVHIGLPVLDDFAWDGFGLGAFAGVVARIPLKPIMRPLTDADASLQISVGCEFAKVGFAELDGSPNMSMAVVVPIRN